jgi:PKD repeat protein
LAPSVLASLLGGLLGPFGADVAAAAQPAEVPAANEPVVVSFSTPGAKDVSLTVSNWSGSHTLTQQVVVLDPNPSISSLTATPASPRRCETVSLGAVAAGRPPLSYSWQILDADQVPVATLPAGNPTSWTVPASAPPGTVFTAKLVVDNVEVPVAERSEPFTVAPLAATFAPIVQELAPSVWQFSLAVPEAIEWSWDFDDDANPLTTEWSAWTTEPVSTFFYRWTGLRTIRVRIRTCFEVQPSPAVEGGLTTLIDVTTVEPTVFSDAFESGSETAWGAIAGP